MKLPSWPSVIIAVVTGVFLAVVAFIFFSLRHRVELVTPDYYEQSLRHQDHLDSVRRARQLAGGPWLRVDGRSAQVVLPQVNGVTGSLYLYRPSNAKLDQVYPLLLDGAGRQTFDLSGLAAGLWRIRLGWTVSNQSYLVEDSLVLPATP